MKNDKTFYNKSKIKCFSCGKEFEPIDEWQNNCMDCMDEFNQQVETMEMMERQAFEQD